MDIMISTHCDGNVTRQHSTGRGKERRAQNAQHEEGDFLKQLEVRGEKI